MTAQPKHETRNPQPVSLHVTILGSGTGVPHANRHAPGIAVDAGGTKILFDSGSGTAYQLAHAKLKYHEFDHLFYSHYAHPDHINDLPELLFANKYFDPRRTRGVHIYGPSGIRNFIEKLADLYPVLAILDYPITIQDMSETSINVGEVTVNSKPLEHQGNASVGYRVEYRERSIAYSGDTDYCETLVALARDADVFIVECSFPNEHKVKGHLVPEEIAGVAIQANVKKVILTHLYPPCDTVDVVAQVENGGFDGEVIKAEDLMKITI